MDCHQSDMQRRSGIKLWYRKDISWSHWLTHNNNFENTRCSLHVLRLSTTNDLLQQMRDSLPDPAGSVATLPNTPPASRRRKAGRCTEGAAAVQPLPQLSRWPSRRPPRGRACGAGRFVGIGLEGLPRLLEVVMPLAAQLVCVLLQAKKLH